MLPIWWMKQQSWSSHILQPIFLSAEHTKWTSFIDRYKIVLRVWVFDHTRHRFFKVLLHIGIWPPQIRTLKTVDEFKIFSLVNFRPGFACVEFERVQLEGLLQVSKKRTRFVSSEMDKKTVLAWSTLVENSISS